MSERVPPGRATGWTVVNVLVVLYALFPVLWILSPIAEADVNGQGRQADSVVQVTFDNYKADLSGQHLHLGVGQLDRHRSDHDGDRGRRGWHGRVRDRPPGVPGKRALVGVALLIAMFPQISLVTPLFNIERRIGLFDTWPGLIIPYITFALPLAIYTMSAFFKEIPWDLEKAAKMDGATPGQASAR